MDPITFESIGPLGGGSDYAPFLNHLGIASVDFGYKFQGSYPVYVCLNHCNAYPNINDFGRSLRSLYFFVLFVFLFLFLCFPQLLHLIDSPTLPQLCHRALSYFAISLSVTLLLLCLHASLCELHASLSLLALFNLFHSLTLLACSLSPTLFYSMFYSR
jgi:hypothetical protein